MGSDEPVTSGARRPIVAAGLVLILALAAYAALLRTELRETYAALEEATTAVAQMSSELVVARQDADLLVDTLGVLESDNLVRVDLRGRGRGAAATGRAFVSPARGVVLHVSGMPAAAPGRAFQLWVVAGPSATSVGTFAVNAFGAATVTRFLPAGLGPLTALHVTEEPAGGASAPSADPLLTGAVPAA